MSNYKEISGDLILLAKAGKFDMITHGCNCFYTMGAGIAVSMKEHFDCDRFKMEAFIYRGDINKLGTIDYKLIDLFLNDKSNKLIVINSYTQYKYGSNHMGGDKNPVDYEAITLCMRKINHRFAGGHIGLPKIGAGLAGGDWNRIKTIIQEELRDCDVTVVNYVK